MSSPKWKLTIYEEDDSTVWTDCTTDPVGSRPYLKPVKGGIQSEVDLVEGSAMIGQLNIQILDKRLTAADQDTGWFTAKLATSGGDSALIGHRVLLERDLGSGYGTVFDGVIADIRLNEAIVTYDLVLKDIRERERKIRCFTKADTVSLLPKGLATAYGNIPGTTNYLIPVVTPGRGDYDLLVSGYGLVKFESMPVIEFDEKMRDFGRPVMIYDDDGSYLGFGFPKVKVRWRPAVGGSWTEFENMKSREHKNLFLNASSYVDPSVYGIRGIYINDPDTPSNLPSDEQSIDFQVLIATEPTEEYPLVIEETAGKLLKDLYDGVYSNEDPRIRYDSTRMSALVTDSPKIRLRITKSVDDMQDWIRKNIYQPMGWAPALNADGEIYPISWELPDENESLTEFSNTVVRPDARWEHSSRDAITLVEVLYQRDYIPESVREAGVDEEHWRIPMNIREVEVKHEIRSPAASLLGDKPLKIEAETLRAIGGADGEPVSGDVRDELGAKLAQLRARQALDRFRYGGQRFTLRGRRSQIDTILPGDWGYVSASWLPEYSTGERGANRLVQVLGISDIDPEWRELQCVDAGAHAQPIAQPTLGTVTADSDCIVSIPVTSVPSGGTARVDYAVNTTEPDTSSGLWTYVGRTNQITTLKTPPLPAGKKVWIRSRGEAEGRRRSAWTTATSVITPSTPVVTECSISIDEAGVPTVYWTRNSYAEGVRIYRKKHDAAEEPGTFSSYDDADADDGSKKFTSFEINEGEAFSVEIEPWTQYPIAGTAGPRVALTMPRIIEINPPPDAPSLVVLYVKVDEVEIVDA